MKQFTSKLNTGLLIILIVLVLALLGMVGYKNYKTTSVPNNSETIVTNNNKTSEIVKEVNPSDDTYTYKNHGFEIELPKGFIPSEMESEGGPYVSIGLPYISPKGEVMSGGATMHYVSNKTFLLQNGGYCSFAVSSQYQTRFTGTIKIGFTTFDEYVCGGSGEALMLYVFEKDNTAYILPSDDVAKTFKFVGYNN